MGERPAPYPQGIRDGNGVEAVNTSREQQTRHSTGVRDAQADLFRVTEGCSSNIGAPPWGAAEAIGPPEERVNSGTF